MSPSGSDKAGWVLEAAGSPASVGGYLESRLLLGDNVLARWVPSHVGLHSGVDGWAVRGCGHLERRKFCDAWPDGAPLV